jgi:glycosyltransferase involved in cell wall biosynthesis
MIVPTWDDPVIPGIVKDLHAEGLRRGAEVFAIARRESREAPDFCEEDGLRLYRVGWAAPAWLGRGLEAVCNVLAVPVQTCRILGRENHDLVHYHFGGIDWNLVSLAQAWMRKPLVATVHSPLPPPHWLPLMTMCRMIIRRARAVSTIARSYERVLRERFPWAGDKLSTIENGIDVDFFRKAGSGAARRPYLLSLARLSPYKGLDLMLFAFLDLLREGRDLDWLIAGPEEDEGDFRGLVRRLGLEDRVHLLGALPKREVARLLKGCQFTVMPARMGGSYSLAILEAFAAGKTVVATAAADGQEWRLTHGKDSLLFPARDIGALKAAVARLLDDEVLRSELEKGAAQTLRPLGRDAMCESYLAWYRGALRPAWT